MWERCQKSQQTRFRRKKLSCIYTWATETDCMAATLVAISTKARGTKIVTEEQRSKKIHSVGC
jgi:hypothetical protein